MKRILLLSQKTGTISNAWEVSPRKFVRLKKGKTTGSFLVAGTKVSAKYLGSVMGVEIFQLNDEVTRFIEDPKKLVPPEVLDYELYTHQWELISKRLDIVLNDLRMENETSSIHKIPTNGKESDVV